MALAPHAGDGPVDRAIQDLQERARLAPNPLPYLERLGWVFVAKARSSYDPGFYKLAEQCALSIEAKKPESAEALLLRSHVLVNLHRFAEAEALGRQLVAQRGLPFDHALLGDALMEQGKLAEAIASYQRLMDQRPGPQAYSRAAHVRWLKGDLAGAIELMSMSAGTSGTWDREAAAWAHVRLASYELEAGRPETASRLIEAALAFQPDYPPALLLRGRLLLAQGKHLEAVSPLRLAASLNPLPEHHWVLAEALKAAGREEEAARVEARLLQQGAKDDPRTFSLYLATTGKDLPAAVRLGEEELRVRSDVFTLDALAWAYRGAGRIQEAQVLSGRALAEGTQDARLFYHAGVIAATAGRNEEAQRRLESARLREQMLLPSERRHLREVLAYCQSLGPPTKNLSQNSSVGPRPSERADGKERRRRRYRGEYR